jgi:hypothetical protein
VSKRTVFNWFISMTLSFGGDNSMFFSSCAKKQELLCTYIRHRFRACVNMLGKHSYSFLPSSRRQKTSERNDDEVS